MYGSGYGIWQARTSETGKYDGFYYKLCEEDYNMLFLLLFFVMSQLYLLESNGRMDALQYYILFNSISVASGQWEGDNERL